MFTVFPVAFRAMVEEDINMNSDYYLPNYIIESHLYFYGRDRILFNNKKFHYWLLLGILESTTLFFFLLITIGDSLYYFNFETSY